MGGDDFGHRVWRYLTFANWTWSDRDDAARIRAGWPTWRRAVRPLGALAWWAGAVLGVVTNESRSPASFALLGIVLMCVAYGAADGIVMRRARKQARRQRSRPVPDTEGVVGGSGRDGPSR